MTENPTIDRYAVFGNPIAHSKSPRIHTLFAQQTNQNIRYTAELAETDQFEKRVREFLHSNGKGLNITVPFKENAWSFADSHSARALRAGAVNTLLLQDDGKVYGDTTDGVGLARDLDQNHNIRIKDKNILIIGAGGAVRGVLEALLDHHPASLIIANRTKHKAVELAQGFTDLGNIQGCGLDELDDKTFDLIINGTSASLHGELPPIPETVFAAGASSYDMMYSKEATPFMKWSASHGAEKTFDGLGMLVEQAAESFYIWRGVKPQTQAVINEVRRTL